MSGLSIRRKSIMKRNKYIKSICLISVLFSILVISIFGVTHHPDTDSYLRAIDVYANGQLDELRTPIYPLFLLSMKSLVGNNFLIATICLQHIVFLISVFSFYQLTVFLFCTEKKAFLITLFYVLCPSFLSYNSTILAESFTISFSVILLHFIIRIYTHRGNELLNILIVSIILAAIIFLRPAQIYFLPIIALFYIIQSIRERNKLIFAGLIPIILISGCLYGYMKVFERQYGILSTSNVTVLNQLYVARQYGLLVPKATEDINLQKAVEESYIDKGERMENDKQWGGPLWSETYKIYNSSDLCSINALITQSYKLNYKKWIASLGSRLYWSGSYTAFPVTNSLQVITQCLGLCLNSIYLILIIYGTIVGHWIVRKKQLPIIAILLLFLCTSNILLSIVGAQNHWNRLILPSIPFFILMFGQLCNYLSFVSPTNEIKLK